MASMHFPRYVRPTENWCRSAALSATSEFVPLYEATRASNDDPAHPWWATSGSATLTAALGGSREIGIVALIHNNGDDAKVITIGGAISTTINAKRGANGYPRNVAYIPSSPATGSSITVAIAGNSANWAVGELVVGKLREWTFPVFPSAKRGRKRIQLRDTNDDFEHDIHYDIGAERWRMSGRTFCHDDALADWLAWWESTNGGTIPTLIVPNEVDAEPHLVYLDMEIIYSNDGAQQHTIDFEMVEAQRGILVV